MRRSTAILEHEQLGSNKLRNNSILLTEKHDETNLSQISSRIHSARIAELENLLHTDKTENIILFKIYMKRIYIYHKMSENI